jgi:hypothetical protein
MVLSGADEIYYFNTAFGHFTESDNVLRVPTFEELWGMVDWINVNVDIWSDGKMTFWESRHEGDAQKTDPYTALLQALLQQSEEK